MFVHDHVRFSNESRLKDEIWRYLYPLKSFRNNPRFFIGATKRSDLSTGSSWNSISKSFGSFRLSLNHFCRLSVTIIQKEKKQSNDCSKILEISTKRKWRCNKCIHINIICLANISQRSFQVFRHQQFRFKVSWKSHENDFEERSLDSKSG